MRRVFSAIALLIVIAYLYALWSDWFTNVDLSHVGKRPIFSEELDLRKAGPIVWAVPRENWIFRQGEAHLALSLNLNTLREIPANRRQVDLRVKIRAEGRTAGGDWQDRLVRNWYFTTDEPFSLNSGLWESYGQGRYEFGLAGVQVVADEELRITIEVQVPDGQLMTGNPRLKLVAKYDYAAIGPEMFFLFLLREGGFWVSVVIVVVLAGFAGKPWLAGPKLGEPGGS